MPQIGPLEIAVVLLIALLVFGPNRLPEMARQVGGALRELRKIQHNITADIHEMMADESDGAAPPPTLPPKTDAATGDVIDVQAFDAGLPPADVPTSGSGEDTAAGSFDDVPPPPPPDPD
ncbi:MAG: twin-arginine translocase TatA/TatE family subunit [Acidimicrobiia bacterium]|jgi:TatA/E family protein of Tat protein translocase